MAGAELLSRQALHAERLTIRLPGEDEERLFVAPLPADMKALLAALRSGQPLVAGADHQSATWRRAPDS